MNLAEEIFNRIETLGISRRKVFAKADVSYRLITYWLAEEPKQWGPWKKMLDTFGYTIPQPGVKTVDHLGAKYREVFLQSGYQINQVMLWSMGDPKAVEHYKRIIYTLNQLENELHRSTTQNEAGQESTPVAVA